jgi:hypothetical protein
MTRSRDIAEILGLTEAENTDNLSLGAGGGGGSGVTSYAYDSAGALLAADSSGYEDGSLHYLSKLREMYVWDDSDGGFFKVDELSESKLAAAISNRTNAQGDVSGYTLGGSLYGPGLYTNIIDKYLFATDGNAVDVGDLAQNSGYGSGHSSSTHGYVAHGFTNPPTVQSNGIERFSFATDGNASIMNAQLTRTGYRNAGVSSDDNAYVLGSITSSYPAGTPVMDKFSFTSDVNATTAGSLTREISRLSGNNSITHGYATGGRDPNGSNWANYIEKFPFAIDTNATDVGDLTVGRREAGPSGSNSSTHGYMAGGASDADRTASNVIEKFSFASDGNATDVGDLSTAKAEGANTSSGISGYAAAGTSGQPSNTNGNSIQKFPFASDTGSASIGFVTVDRRNMPSTQV